MQHINTHSPISSSDRSATPTPPLYAICMYNRFVFSLCCDDMCCKPTFDIQHVFFPFTSQTIVAKYKNMTTYIYIYIYITTSIQHVIHTNNTICVLSIDMLHFNCVVLTEHMCGIIIISIPRVIHVQRHIVIL